MDDTGNLYIADPYYTTYHGHHRIRKVDPNGIITTVAGTGERGFSGDGGLAVEAGFEDPADVILDSSGNLYIADYFDNRIRMVDPTGIINTVAGTGIIGFSGDEGLAIEAKLHWPYGISVDRAGNINFQRIHPPLGI